MTLSFTIISDYINQLLQQANLSVDPVIGQSIAAIIIFLVFLIIGWIVYFIFKHYFSKWAKKTKTNFDDEIIRNTKKPVYLFVILLGCYYAIDQFTTLDAYASILTQLFLILEILLIAFTITRVINVFVVWYSEQKVKRGNGAISGNILIVFKKLLHVIVYIFAFLFILYISKVDLSGALVGLGVGGIAIAFALQNVLSDAFSAFSIYFDRPFEIGDFIVIGDNAGTVTNISMKSTRMKLLQGEELVISNRTILENSIHNYKKLQKRRVVFTIGVTYNTSVEKLKKIESLIREIIKNCQLCEVDRIHFKEFGAFSLNFEVVYYINSSDYNKYMDVQQQINFGIAEAFEKENIEIAFPTQTIFLNTEPTQVKLE